MVTLYCLISQKIGEVVEPFLLGKYGDLYTDIGVELTMPPGDPKNVSIKFKAAFKERKPEWFINPSREIEIMEANPKSIDKWMEAYHDLINITRILDNRNNYENNTKNKLKNIYGVSGYKIRKEKLPNNIFLTKEEWISIVSKSARFFHRFVFIPMRRVSKSWAATQMIYLCRQGLRDICEDIEEQLKREPGTGDYEWYLEKIYEREHMGKAIERIKNTRPTQTSLHHLLDEMTEIAEQTISDNGDLFEKMRKKAYNWTDKIMETSRKLGKHASQRIENGDTILTHCYGGPAIYFMGLSAKSLRLYYSSFFLFSSLSSSLQPPSP